MQTADLIYAAARALGFVFLFHATGVALFLAVHGRIVPHTAGALRRPAIPVAAIALVLVVLLQLLEGVRLSGELRGMVDPALHAIALDMPNAAAAVIRGTGLLLVMLAMLRDSPAAGTLGVFGAALALVSFVFTGHVAAAPLRAWLTPLLLIHLLVAAYWFGALIGLLRAVRCESPIAAANAVLAFSTTAVRLVPLIAVCGVLMACVLLPDFAALWTVYGLLLIAKSVGFAALMFLAARNHRRHGPAMLRGEPAAQAAFCSTTRGEVVLIALVLLVTATMTSLFSPD